MNFLKRRFSFSEYILRMEIQNIFIKVQENRRRYIAYLLKDSKFNVNT